MKPIKRTRRQRHNETASATVRLRPVATTLPTSVEAVLSSPGEPLDAALRGEMESRLGHNFGDVRVHTDARAEAAARTLDAEAFTRGADIVFAAGRYRPGSADGRWLIAHELVHTLQQGGVVAAVPQASAAVVADDDPLEREAGEVAGWIATGQPVPPGTVTLAAPAVRSRIARKARIGLERLPAEVPDSPEAVRALAGDVVRLLVSDPDDGSGRVKRRLARLAPETRAAVANELAGRVPAPAATRLREILAELLPPGARAPVTEPFEPPSADEQAEPSAEPAESAAAEPAAAEPSAEPEEGIVTAAMAPSPAEVESGESEDVSVPEGRVAEPQIEGEVVTTKPDVAPSAGDAQGDGRPASVGGSAPALDTAEAAGPEEDAAAEAPVDETEQEALEAHDEADAEDVGEAPDVVVGGAEESRAGADAMTAVERAGAEDAGPLASPAPVEGPGASADAAGSLDAGSASAPGESMTSEAASESDGPGPADPEPVPDDEEHVVEPSALEMAGEDEESVAEPPPAQLEGADEIGTAAAEPDETAGPELADEESTADEAASVDAGGDEGGAAPIEEPAEPEAPDLSEADPAAAMEAAGTLPPAQSDTALTGVDAAASRSVGAQRAALADQPPALDRPTGAPALGELETESEEATEPPEAPERLERSAQPPALAPTRVAPLPPAPPLAAARTPAPQIPGGAQGELSEGGRRALQASLGALPVHDPALDVSVGPTPAIALDGAADPQRANDERAKLESAARGALADGRREILKPAGEQHLVPDAPQEQLRAAIAPAATAPPGAPAVPEAAGAAGATMAATDPASILARHERGAELRAAAKNAAAGMRARRTEHAVAAADERRRSQEQVTQLVHESAVQHAERRADARREVHDQRRRWSAAEHGLAESKLTGADAKLGASAEEVTRLKSDADRKAATHLETGERDAEQARRDAEGKAAAERSRGQEKASGPLGWLADQATALFDEIKAGITKIFEVARAAVREAIERAKKLAAEAIDVARAAIVAAITLAGAVLIAIGDTLLASLPGVRDRFRRAIGDRVATARAAINELAEGLKRVVQKALDGLGAALDAALGLLEKGLLLMVEGYRTVLAGALKWANALVKGFAAFAVLAKHIAANPKQWLTNLAASAKDGVKNHLWKAFKAAIKRWFSEKVEEVLGLGLSVWNLLSKGGISLARIGTMAWEAIKAAIPPTLVQILIEKLISLLIPAAAAVMLILETLQAAWGTIQRVIQAFERFFAFLKAVRTGRAGPQFATAIAAAAIAVIDFVANWLLKRLRKPAGKIAKKLREIAKKLGKKLGKVAKKIGKSLFGKRNKPKRLKGKPTKKPKPDKRAKAERRVKAAAEFLGRQLTQARPRPILWAQMQYARGRWRVRVRLRERGEEASLAAEANPRIILRLTATYPPGGPDIDKYRARAAAFQGFLRRRHEIHHVLSVARSDWWEAADLDWNHEDLLLEVPRSLHKAMHRPYYEVDAARAARVTQEAQDDLTDSWNVEWGRWLLPKLKAIGVTSPTALRKSSLRTKSAARSLISRGKNHVVALFSALFRVNLWRFRLRGGVGQRISKRFSSKLSRLEQILRTARLKKPQRQTAILNWIAHHVPRVMSGKKARRLLRFVKTGER